MAEEPYTRNIHRHVGKRFGAWTVVCVAGRNIQGKTIYLCQCECGSTRSMRIANILNGSSKSCGCMRSELAYKRVKNPNPTSRSSEYRVWAEMKGRCIRPNNPAFHNYGGRGISVCDRWMKFSAFISDMGPRPTPQHTLERKDNEAGYSPDNCVWATTVEQNNNRRSNVFVVFNGERMTLAQAIGRSGLPKVTVYMRRHLGWREEFWFIPLIRNRRPNNYRNAVATEPISPPKSD